MTMDIYYKYKTQNNVKSNKNLVQKRPFLHPPAQIPIISRVQITKRSLYRKKRWISFAMKHVAHYTNSLLSVS